ncbi:unnamed protein product, partial [Musa banksii]
SLLPPSRWNPRHLPETPSFDLAVSRSTRLKVFRSCVSRSRRQPIACSTKVMEHAILEICLRSSYALLPFAVALA